MANQADAGDELLYRAFISYSRADREVAKALQAKLEGYVLPQALRHFGPGLRRKTRPLKPVFRDEDELVPGQDLPERIRASLRAAQYMIVLCSPSAAASDWVAREILEFAAVGKAADILAVVVDGEPDAAGRGFDPARECLPRALRFRLETSASAQIAKITDEPAEPLWVDWRPAGRKDRAMFLRMVAALLALARFDELVRRDARERRRQRALWGAMAAAAFAAVAVALYGLSGVVREQDLRRSDRLAQLAADAAAQGDYGSASRLALAGLERSQWPLIGFAPLAAEDQLRNAELLSGAPRFWDAPAGVPTGQPLEHGAYAVAFSADGTRLATASFDHSARLWDAYTGAPIGQPMQHASAVHAVAFSPDGARVATASYDQTARLWDGHSGAPIGATMQHDAPVNAVAFSPDGTRPATAQADNTASLWDARTGAPIGQLPRQATRADDTGDHPIGAAVAFSPDGTRLVSAAQDNTARLWDARTGAPIGRAMQHGGWVIAVAFSSDGTRVATASEDNTARLWDARTGAPIGQPLAHGGWVQAVAFSPDGTRVATASYDKTARLWDARTGAPIGPPLRHDGGVNAVAFSPDGTLLATASDDQTSRLWDARTGAPIGQPMRQCGLVDAVAFSPDGARLATASWEEDGRLWRLPPPLIEPVGALRQRACTVLRSKGLAEFTRRNATVRWPWASS